MNLIRRIIFWLDQKVIAALQTNSGKKFSYWLDRYYRFQRHTKWFRWFQISIAVALLPYICWIYGKEITKNFGVWPIIVFIAMIFNWSPFPKLIFRFFRPNENERNHLAHFNRMSDADLVRFWSRGQHYECHIHKEVRPTVGPINLTYNFRDVCMIDQQSGNHYDPQYFIKWLGKKRPALLKRIKKLEVMT